MKRVDAWSLREQLREHRLAPTRARGCGRLRFRRTLTLETDGQGAWWAGVQLCRSRTCPVCFIARRHRLACEIEHTVREREAETAQQSWLATLTVRHGAADAIGICKAVRACWRSLIQGRGFRQWMTDHQVEWIAAEEITFGDNGWHPHLHVLCLPREPIEAYDDPIFPLQGMWFASWARVVGRRMGEAHVPLPAYGAYLSPCDSAGYLSKLGLELADPGVVKGRSPLALLAQGQLDLYCTLQRARRRARDVTFSRGLAEIRKSVPDAPMTAPLAEVRGSQWTELLAQGWQVPLEVLLASTDPDTADAALGARLHDYEPGSATGRLWQTC